MGAGGCRHRQKPAQTFVPLQQPNPQQGVPSYALWVAKKKELPPLLAAWAKTLPPGLRRELLEARAVAATPKEWVVWALADASGAGLASGGFFAVPPCEPQMLVFMQAGETNVIHHIVASPTRPWPSADAGLQQWIESIRPKRCIVQSPQEFGHFGLSIPT